MPVGKRPAASDTRIIIRVTPALKKRLEAIATKRRKTLSYIVRESLVETAKRA